MEISSHYLVPQAQIKQFQEKGFIKLKKIANQEDISVFRVLMNQVVDRKASEADKQNRIDDYSTIFTQVTNIWNIQPKTQPFVFNSRFADIARQLLEVKNVRLYHDQALVKQPKAGMTPWHQDQFYWPIDSSNTVTMWMPMHDCPREMGTMKFAIGSHRSQNLKQMPISEESEQYFLEQIKQNGFQIETFDLQVGDATFHYGKTLHCAHSNGMASNREAMTIIYFEDGAKVMDQSRMNQFKRVDLSVFCPNSICGQIIQSELNPILA